MYNFFNGLDMHLVVASLSLLFFGDICVSLASTIAKSRDKMVRYHIFPSSYQTLSPWGALIVTG